MTTKIQIWVDLTRFRIDLSTLSEIVNPKMMRSNSSRYYRNDKMDLLPRIDFVERNIPRSNHVYQCFSNFFGPRHTFFIEKNSKICSSPPPLSPPTLEVVEFV